MLNLLAIILYEAVPGGVGPAPGFPCVITAGSAYAVSVDTTTDCDPIYVENDGILILNTNITLTQNNP
jgi:hypothetical protein